MLKSYIKIAIRNLWKHKLFSFINITGLGLAMAFCFMQLIQVQSSFEQDSFHPYPNRTFRILTDATDNVGEKHSLASTPFPLGQKLADGQSVIEKTVRINRSFGTNLSNGIKTLRTYGLYVEPAYFEVFGFPLEKGKPATEPWTAVLTHEMAERYFGDANPIGKTLTNSEIGTFTITGVFKPLKKFRTHLGADMAISMATLPLVRKDLKADDWLSYNTYTFVFLTKGSSRADLDQALARVSAESQKTVRFKDIKTHSFRSQALSEISPDWEGLLDNPGAEPIWKMGVSLLIPLLIIVLAGFNYINLTLTRSLSRAREVGVRKVAGAKKYQLVSQFLVETIVIALLAFGLGYLGLVFLQEYIHVGWITWEVSDTRLLWAIFIGFTLFTGFVAGILPARILSSYQPVQILKGETAPTGLGKFGFRKTLTVIQFVVALVFMTGTGIMNSQFEYMATDNENFNRKNILNIPLAPDSDFRLLANEMSRDAGVKRVGLTSATLNESAGKAKLSPLSPKSPIAPVETFIYASDRNFIENMRLRFLAGENVPATIDTTVHFVVLNQKAAQWLGWKNPKEAVGQTILLNETQVIVSGIVKNFCFMRYELPVAPLVLAFDPREIKVLSLEVAAGTDRERLTAALGKTWKQYHPHESFVYSWYEDQLYEDYLENEDQKITALLVFVVFTIAAMGLLGMVTYSTAKRVKEVGVRKVMGASTGQIMRLLSGSFVKLILIAAIIAMPIGYGLGALFLNIFTYHPSLSPGVFLTCIGSLGVIGLLTIGIQTYKAAVTNPAETLRND